MDIKLNEKVRKELWYDMNDVEFRINSLKGVFQNETPITQEIIEQFINKKEEIIQQLDKLQDKFEIEVKAEEYYQILIKDLKDGSIYGE